jgi:hypothetical protein
MLYKISKLSFIFLLILSTNASALQWPYSEKNLLNNVNKAHVELENKTNFCMDLRKRELHEIQSDWLFSLPEKKRKGVLFIVSMIVFERCTSEESTQYLAAVMRYTAETENKKFLDEWLLLNNYRFEKDVFNEFLDVPPNKIIELSQRPELYYPFNPMGVEAVVVPESK